MPEWVVLTERCSEQFVVRRRITQKYYRLVYVDLPAIRDGQQKSQTCRQTSHSSVDIIEQESYRQEKIMDYPVYQQFHAARNILSGCKWGIGGSLGFELSTGIPAVKKPVILICCCTQIHRLNCQFR